MSPTIILLILLAIASAGDILLGKLYVGAKQDYASEKQAYADFVAGVKVIGDKQEKEAKAKTIADQKLKDKADAENATTVANLAATVKRLRDTRNDPGSSIVPAAPSGSSRPSLACFERADFDRALRTYEEGLTGLLEEGSKNTLDLNTARDWARK